MSLGVDKTLEVLAALQDVTVRGSVILKSGHLSLSLLGSLFPLVEDLRTVVADAQLVLPELKDLDAAESARLAAAAYEAVKAVLAAVG